MKKFFLVLIILIVSMFVYSRFINTSGFKVVEDAISIADLPDSFEGFKIVQFSDVLLGSTPIFDTCNKKSHTRSHKS